MDFEFPAPNDWLWNPWSNRGILALFLACVLMIASAFLVPLIGDTPVLILFIAIIIISLYLFLSSRIKHARRFEKPRYTPVRPAREMMVRVRRFLNHIYYISHAKTW